MVRYHHIEDKYTTRGLLDLTLLGILNGKIGVEGHKPGDIEGLDGVVISVSGPPDGSLNKGDVIPFGTRCEVEVLTVGSEVNDGHVRYRIAIYTKCKPLE